MIKKGDEVIYNGKTSKNGGLSKNGWKEKYNLIVSEVPYQKIPLRVREVRVTQGITSLLFEGFINPKGPCGNEIGYSISLFEKIIRQENSASMTFTEKKEFKKEREKLILIN